MKKKEKVIDKKSSHISSKMKTKKGGEQTVKKVIVGEDEFCPSCMEWRKYDETTGKCMVCGRLIKKSDLFRTIIYEYDLKDFSFEHDEQQDIGEY